MTIPQPASSPYKIGDDVRIYLSETDPDAVFNDVWCTIVERLEDDLQAETGRELDQYIYRVENRETGEEIPITFRHYDLVQPRSLRD
jgi:hypothetical protein